MGKPKKVNFELIPEYDGDHQLEPYELMDEIRGEHHDHLACARIALAWRKELKPDVDGHLVLGRCIKASDLQRELAEWDFVILLNREVWDDLRFTKAQKLALLDHELCHAELARDEDGEAKIDEKGRMVWRIRKHDIEEFQAIVQRHGCYKRDLEKFAETLINSKKSTDSLFAEESDTTVSIGVPGKDGKIKYSEPIKHSEFVERCKDIARIV